MSYNSAGNSVLGPAPYLRFKLLNPLLNGLFSTNDPLKSGLKDIYLAFLQDRFAYAIVVPDSHVLLNYYDNTNGVPYRELALRPDFIKHHLIDLRHLNNHITRNTNLAAILNTKKSKTYHTASNNEIILKKDQIIVNDSNSRNTYLYQESSISSDPQSHIKVSKIQLFVNFNLFFPKNSEFLLIHVDRPLVGTPIPEILYKKLQIPQSVPLSLTSATFGHSRSSSFNKQSPAIGAVPSSSLKSAVAKVIPGVSDSNEIKTSFNDHDDWINEFGFLLQVETPKVTFHQLLGRFPLINQQIGEDFQHLFKNFVIESINDPHEIVTLFKETINQSALIFKSLDGTIIDAVFNYAPSIDLNRCIYDYVELKLFDKIWRQLVKVLNKPNDREIILGAEEYENLQNISITQVGLFDDKLFSAKRHKSQPQLNMFLSKIDTAVKVFQHLPLANSYAEKSRILLETFAALTKSMSITISTGAYNELEEVKSMSVNADMLVALMILVVVRSKVNNCHVHLEYIKRFSYVDPDVGLVGYAISTLEAVLYHLQNKSNFQQLSKCSALNMELYQILESKQVDRLVEFIQEQTQPSKSFLPLDHCLKSINFDGDSLLMQAIKVSNYEMFKTLINNELIYPIEDILYDYNLNKQSLLLSALINEKNSIVDEIISIVSSTCTITECIQYYNFRDSYQRNIGHYLFHYDLLIGKIGLFIDWSDKDLNSNTPLLSLCRNYDMPNYPDLMSKVFATVDQWYALQNKVFSLEDHVDNKGNTLLHTLKSNLKLVLQYKFVNVNQFNQKHYSPLALYIKYNRLDNIKEILNDDRLNINKTDTKTFLTILDFVKMNSEGSEESSEIEKYIDGYCLKHFFPLVDKKKFGILRAKLDKNQWFFIIKGQIIKNLDQNKLKIHHYSNYHSLNDFRDLIRLLHIEYPVSYLPIIYMMSNFNRLNITSFAFFNFNKLKINTLMVKLNIFLVGLLLSKDFTNHELLWEFLILPAINTPSLENRSRLKMESNKEKLSINSQISESPVSASPNIPEEFTDTGLDNLEELFAIDRSKNYTIDEVRDIHNFLKYSLEELEGFQRIFKKTVQLVVVTKHKTDDLNNSYKVYLDLLSGLPLLGFDEQASLNPPRFSSDEYYFETKLPRVFSGLCDTLMKLVSEKDNIDEYQKFIYFLQHLESCADRLIRNINSVLGKKITKWLKLALELNSLKAELIKLRPNEFKGENDESPLGASEEEVQQATRETIKETNRDTSRETNGDTSRETGSETSIDEENHSGLSEEDFNVFRLNTPVSPFNTNFDGSKTPPIGSPFTSPLRQASSPNDISKNPPTSSSSLTVPNQQTNQVVKKRSFLSNLIESRRSNYESKVIKQYKINRLKLISLSNDVKFNHESLATEVNNFIEFKGLFLKYAIKVLAKERIKNLKYSSMVFEKGLCDARSLSS